MPSKKKKYNARFPPARIKKIMQSDEEVGKVAQAVPVIISRALELFVESLLKKAETVTNARNAKTLTPSHLKQCILAEQRFDFLKDLVGAIPDVQGDEESAGAETPRSTTSNSPFIFPPASASATSSSSTMNSPVTGPPAYDLRYLSQSSERPSVSSFDPNQVDYRHLNPLNNFSNPPPAHFHHESVIVSHSSILNPVAANSNPYIPIHHASVQLGASTSLPSQQLTMSQQFEYHLQHNLNLNTVSGGSNSSIPIPLSSTRNNESPHNITQGTVMFDNSVSHSHTLQPQFKQDGSD